MSEAFIKLKETVANLADDDISLDEICSALYLLHFECEAVMRIKIVQHYTEKQNDTE